MFLFAYNKDSLTNDLFFIPLLSLSFRNNVKMMRMRLVRRCADGASDARRKAVADETEKGRRHVFRYLSRDRTLFVLSATKMR